MPSGFARLGRALLPLVLLLAGACATTPEPAADAAGARVASGESVVTVENNHTSFTAMTIFLVPDAGGVRRSLGVVENAQTRQFTLPLQRGGYMLVAERPAGDLRSDRFNLVGPSTITWDLQLNRVRVTPR